MFILFNKTILQLDDLVNQYIIYLTHIQQSVNLKASEKINAFNSAESIANDINAFTGKLLSMNINTFNQDDIFKFIDKNFQPIIKGIQSEIKYYDKKLKINDKILFSVKEAIDFLINDKRSDINLSIDKINRFLSYQKLFVDEEEKVKEIKHKVAIEESEKQNNTIFNEIKYKTFCELIRGVNHSNEKYFYDTNKYVIEHYIESFSFAQLNETNKQGIYFVLENDKDIHVIINDGNLEIDYSVIIKTIDSNSSIYIIGFISHASSKVDFFIDESFDSSFMSSYLNAFNLTPLIKKWNECYLQYFTQKETGLLDDIKAKKHIDDFFSGKIQ